MDNSVERNKRIEEIKRKFADIDDMSDFEFEDVSYDWIEFLLQEVNLLAKANDDSFSQVLALQARVECLQEDKRKLQNVYDAQYERACRLQVERDKAIDALIVERNDALTWDGIGTVKRINKALSELGVPHDPLD